MAALKMTILVVGCAAAAFAVGGYVALIVALIP